jgi:N-acetylneuraminic acid mutarotase
MVDGEIYVIGGLDFDDDMVGSVEKYSPASDAWIDVAPLPAGLVSAGRVNNSTVVVGSVIYILGGDINVAHDSVLKFNSAQGIWSEVAPMPAPRGGFASCVYMSGIYVFGGFDERGDSRGSVFKFDTEAGEWSTLAPMPIHVPMPIQCACYSASVIDGQVYITGTGGYGRGREVLRFDIVTSVWSTLAQTLYDRNEGVSFVLAGCLYVAGGGKDASASVERYDVATNTWTAVADMLEERRGFGAICIESVGPTEEQDLFDSLILKALAHRT